MSFSIEQKQWLDAKLDGAFVKERKQGGKTLSYLEGWRVISEANRIFGYDRWSRETYDVQCVADAPRKIGVTETFAGYDGYGVSYICRVRIIVDDVVVREGCGAGHGIDRDRGLAHESALKESETDAMKRALMTFGNPFGLALYDKSQANVSDVEQEDSVREDYIRGAEQEIDQATDPVRLAAWWKSPKQHEARRKYLSDGEMEVLKAKLIAKIEALNKSE